MSDPKAVLEESGFSVPDGLHVKAQENTDSTVHLTLPAAPTNATELSDHELANAAGGTITAKLPTFAGVVGPDSCDPGQGGC